MIELHETTDEDVRYDKRQDRKAVKIAALLLTGLVAIETLYDINQQNGIVVYGIRHELQPSVNGIVQPIRAKTEQAAVDATIWILERNPDQLIP